MCYESRPLWNGHNCTPNCTSPPWFYKQLPTDSIEMRVCRDQPLEDEDIQIESFEIYQSTLRPTSLGDFGMYN